MARMTPSIDFLRRRWLAGAVASAASATGLVLPSHTVASPALVAAAARAHRRATMGALRIAFLSSMVLELLATLCVALVAVGIGLRLVVGDMELAAGIAALVLAPEVYQPLRTVGARFHASSDGALAADRAFEVLHDGDDGPGGGGHVATGGSGRHGGRPGFEQGAFRRILGQSLEGVTGQQPAQVLLAEAAADPEPGGYFAIGWSACVEIAGRKSGHPAVGIEQPAGGVKLTALDFAQPGRASTQVGQAEQSQAEKGPEQHHAVGPAGQTEGQQNQGPGPVAAGQGGVAIEAAGGR